MKRVEIVANQSVREELVAALETGIPALCYTLIPMAHGRGPEDWKLGTVVWPEENFVLFTYQDETNTAEVVRIVGELKRQFPKEGIKVWTVTAD
jgi:hypothetical protein